MAIGVFYCDFACGLADSPDRATWTITELTRVLLGLDAVLYSESKAKGSSLF